MAIDVSLGNAGLAPSATGVVGRPSASERLGFVVPGETRPTTLPDTPRPTRALDESSGRRAFEARDPQRRDDDALAALLGGGRRDVEEPRGLSEREAQTLAARLRLDAARLSQSTERGGDASSEVAGAGAREAVSGSSSAQPVAQGERGPAGFGDSAVRGAPERGVERADVAEARAEARAREAEARTQRAAGIDALQRRIDFAVQLSNPFEPARRELNIFV